VELQSSKTSGLVTDVSSLYHPVNLRQHTHQPASTLTHYSAGISHQPCTLALPISQPRYRINTPTLTPCSHINTLEAK